MAIFVPEPTRVSPRELHIKRVLAALDDEHVVRRPLKRKATSSQDIWFVQHARRGWLVLAVEDAPFADLDASQLFESPHRVAFESRLEQLGHGITSAGERTRGTHDTAHAASPHAPSPPALMLMWACSTDEAKALSREMLGRWGVRLVSRDQFMAIGAKLVRGLLAPIAEDVEHRLLSTWFPESRIPPECSTRTAYRRDNRATLDRLFLDHEQEWASKLDLDATDLPDEQQRTARDFSVRLVNGVAGSGKTLIAMRRALLLCELFPRQRVLLLIHNTPIVADLKQRWRRALGRLPANLEITTFFAWAYRQWRRVFAATPHLADRHRDIAPLLAQLRQGSPTLALTDEQLIDEFDFVNETLIDHEAAYLATNRTGRGFALRARERRAVWALYTAMVDTLHRHGLHLWSALPKALCLAEPQRLQANLEHWHHVLVDEGQFFAPSWFALVRHAMAPGGQLFVCADPNQGFMRSRLSWKTVGLDVAGRTKKLHRSYRTTRAILEAAGAVLALLRRPVDDGVKVVDAAVDTARHDNTTDITADDADDFLEPDLAGMPDGVPPLLIPTASPQDAIDRVANEVEALTRDGRMPLHAVLVIHGEGVSAPALHQRLSRCLGRDKVWWLNEKSQKKEPPPDSGHDHLRMAYVDTATGLEAGIVFLVGIDRLLRGSIAVGETDEHREEMARKLYMAMTRAADRLVVVTSQRVPEDVENLFDRVPSAQNASGPAPEAPLAQGIAASRDPCASSF